MAIVSIMPSARPTQESRLAVNVIGVLDDGSQPGQAAQLYVDAFHAAEVPVATTSIAPNGPEAPWQTPLEPSVNLACMNGDDLVRFARTAGGGVLVQRPTIGQWAWETDVLPPTWFQAFPLLQEIWAFSTFVRDNLERLSPVPVAVVPMPVSVPDPSGVQPPIDQDDRFIFLFMFDFLSSLRRTNVAGLIEAFTRAFAPVEGPRLLLKAINGGLRPEAEAELRQKLADRPDIELVDAHLGPAQNAALLARADCYVSLHRSESFGRTLAESMAVGTPVIATGYSGNLDFTTPANSYLVDWLPSRIGPGGEGYPPEGTWAEPDLDHAAELLRRVWQRPEEARAKADRARADIPRVCAPEAVGRLARGRLERLAAQPTRAVALSDASKALAEIRLVALEDGLVFDPERGFPPYPSGLRGVVRRFLLRLMLPFTRHEHRFDRATALALRGLQVELAQLRVLHDEDRARIQRLEEPALGREGVEDGNARER